MTFITVILAVVSTVSAQPNSSWFAQKKISWSSYGYCVSIGPEGNMYVSGAFSGAYRNPGPTDAGCFIACYDSAGTEKWHKEFFSDKGVAAQNVVTSDGEIVLMGIGLKKFSSDGKLLAIYDEEGVSYAKICNDKSSNTIVVEGTSVTKKFGGFEFSDVTFIARLTSDFHVVRARDFFFDYIFLHEGNDLAVDEWGYVYSAGGFGETVNLSNSVSISSNGIFDGYVAKFDSQFNAIWAKSLGGIYTEFSRALFVNASGDVYVSGYYGSPLAVGSDTRPAPVDGSDSFVAKYDSNGECKWLRGITGTHGILPCGLTGDKNDNIFITGYFYGDQTISWGDLHHTTKDDGLSSGIFLAQADADGNAVSLICSEDGGGGRSCDIKCNCKGSLYLTGGFGGTLSFAGQKIDGDAEMFLLKLNYDVNNKVGLKESTEIEKTFEVYPSPGTGRFNIALPDEMCETADIYMYDASGKCVQKTNIGCGHRILECVVPSGIYLLELRSGNQRQTRKVVIQ